MILVDTSVWIDYFNGHNSVEAAYLGLCIADAGPLTIPGLVLTEILLGVRTEAEAKRITRALSAFEFAPELEKSDYQKAAELYRACRARGLTPRSTRNAARGLSPTLLCVGQLIPWVSNRTAVS